MKKTAILATAIAAVIAAPMAGAAAHGGAAPAVTVYGIAHASLNNNDQADNWTVNSNASRLGFKGSEDLGNGMKATYQMEMGYDLTDGTGVTGTNRNSYVGLAGGFGEVRIGRHDTPAKSAFYASGNDFLGDSIIDLNGLQGFTERRVSNVIAYIAPKMGSIGVLAAAIQGEGSGAGAGTGGNPGDGIGDGVSVGVTFADGPIKAGFGWSDIADLNGQNDNTLVTIGGQYTMDNIKVGLNYETLEVNTTDTTTFAVSAQMSFGMNALILNFGNQEVETAGVKADADSTGVALKHSFSKRTAAYVAFASSDTKSKEKTSFGLTHKF